MRQNRPCVSSWLWQTYCTSGGNEVSSCERHTERQIYERTIPTLDLPSAWSVKIAVPTENGGSRDEASDSNGGWRRKRVLTLPSGFRKMSMMA